MTRESDNVRGSCQGKREADTVYGNMYRLLRHYRETGKPGAAVRCRHSRMQWRAPAGPHGEWGGARTRPRTRSMLWLYKAAEWLWLTQRIERYIEHSVPMPTARRDLAAAGGVLHGMPTLYAIGGHGVEFPLTTVEVYIP